MWNHISQIFVICSIKINCSSCILGELSVHAWVFVISISHLEIIGSPSYVDLPSVDTFNYTISKKLHLLISPAISSQKSLSIVKLSSSWWWIEVFQNSNFHLKAQIFIIGKKYCQLFSLKWQFRFFHFWESVCQIHKSE